MNVFVLSTGRCGSMTFDRACRHIRNFSSGHETRVAELGPARLAYPKDHIESDNRLAWFLGRLDQAFPNEVFYVHLRRDPEAVARSYARRTQAGLIIPAWIHGVHLYQPEIIEDTALAAARDYVTTVNINISQFLAGRKNAMKFDIESGSDDFDVFWERIGAQGDKAAAIAEFSMAYNASP
ncbi:MAG: hypothetical protein H6981_02060 [Gammaproteobacteria bacterium]|nr:hypothetical protein [Gammaproteobacteria bacterium]MCP5135574.1 hypothetical protein [Gammaproteobacteria bacterium]